MGSGEWAERSEVGVKRWACVFVCALAVSRGAASLPERAEREALAGPVLFVKRFNYQGLHIYDTFYQWRPGGGKIGRASCRERV